jgi:hypothetical protein
MADLGVARTKKKGMGNGQNLTFRHAFDLSDLLDRLAPDEVLAPNPGDRLHDKARGVLPSPYLAVFQKNHWSAFPSTVKSARTYVRLASAKRPPEPIFIDTNIVPPPMPLVDAIPDAPSPLQSYASAERPPATFDVGQKKRKNFKKQRLKVATYQLRSANPHVTTSGGSATTVPLTRLSLIDIVSGAGKKLFNLR